MSVHLRQSYCLVCVDDTLFFSPEEKFIDEAMDNVRESNLKLSVEDSVAGFLGVHVERNQQTGEIKLTQEGLTKRIVEALDIGHLPKTDMPVRAEPLVKDKNGDQPDGACNYASIIGMLQHLQGHSRPDIACAVSMCARFLHSPRQSHEEALERTGQHLKGTISERLILKPTGELDIDVYCNSDFAGLWPHKDKLDPTCDLSHPDGLNPIF